MSRTYAHESSSRSVKGSAAGNRVRPLLIDAVFLVLACGIMYWIFPDFVQNIVFDLILRNIILVIPWVFAAYLGWKCFKDSFPRSRRLTVATITVVVIAIAWDISVLATRNYFVYQEYGAYTKRDKLVEVAPTAVRFTPLQNACVDLANSISTSSEHVDCDYVAPILTNHHFGYIAPIVPSGFLQTYTMKNPGFLRFDDSPTVADDPNRRIHRIDDVQQVGPHMEWFDNLERVLVLNDFFANYEKPHYLVLDPKQPEKLTAIVSKIKYSFFFQLPHWAGVVLVHSDGRVEDLDKAKALADPRLAGQWLFPIELDRKYVKLQDYAVGWGVLSPFVRVPGKLEIEKLPGDNQFPFLVQGTDGNPYLVTGTRGEGSARGLFRMYFWNAHTGEGSYHEFAPNEVVYGAGATLQRISNLPGYNWMRKDGDSNSGNMIAVEPVYMTRPGENIPYWKFTITNTEFAGISATAVANGARPDDIKLFRTRNEFEAWKSGNFAEVKTSVVSGGNGTAAAPLGRDQEIKARLDHIEAAVFELRKLLDAKQ